MLASSSPRRRALLAELGLDFAVRPADLDESVMPGERPDAYVERLAVEKACAICRTGELVLAADTTVVLDGNILGKPRDAEEARSMLAALAGRRHLVLSGVALARGRDGAPECVSGVAQSEVELQMSPRELEWYVRSAEGLDKAGAYGIQGLGALFVIANYGSYTNVFGLPLGLVRALFARLGEDLLERLPRPRDRAAGSPAVSPAGDPAGDPAESAADV